MNKFKLACLITCLLLCAAIFGGLINAQIAMAQAEEGQAPPEEKIELTPTHRVLLGASDAGFQFEVKLQYTGGEEPRYFDLQVEGPEGWLVQVQESASATRPVADIRLDPARTYPETVVVFAMPPYWQFPEPGDYTINMGAASGEIKASTELIARITATYDFTFETPTKTSGSLFNILNIKATAGKESPFSITITNTGTDTLDKVTFSSTKPSGIAGEEWSITFKPDKIESLDPLDKQEVEVTVKPPPKTIAGDYPLTLNFSSDPKSWKIGELDVRVTVGTSTKWGWIGAGIVVAVIAGLVIGFRQLGRR